MASMPMMAMADGGGDDYTSPTLAFFHDERVKQWFPDVPFRLIHRIAPLIRDEIRFNKYGMDDDFDMIAYVFATIKLECNFVLTDEKVNRNGDWPNTVERPFDAYDTPYHQWSTPAGRRRLGIETAEGPALNPEKPISAQQGRLINRVQKGNRVPQPDTPVQETDGWRYRGRGFIQLTGKSNYAEMEKKCRISGLVANPDLAGLPENAAAIAVRFIFDRKKRIAGALKKGDFKQARAAVNGTGAQHHDKLKAAILRIRDMAQVERIGRMQGDGRLGPRMVPDF